MQLSRTLAPLMFAACLTPLPAVAQTAAESTITNPRSMVFDDVSRSDFSTTLANLKEQLKGDGWNIVAEVNLAEVMRKSATNLDAQIARALAKAPR